MKESKDWDDIEVNKRSTDKVFFESTILQQISDSIDFIRDESKEILSELDYDGFEDALVWYAKNRSELSGVKIYLRGDADNDSSISILDATAIQRKLAELSVETFDDDHADYDLDGTVTIVDATGIQRELAGL